MTGPQPDGETPPVDEGRRRFISWLWRVPVLAALGGGAWAGWRFYSVHYQRQPANPEPSFQTHAPQVVGSVAEFAEPWATVEFTYEHLPAIAVRVPEAIPGGVSSGDMNVVAFSRICTHQGCPVEFSRDPEAVAFAFNYRTETPSLVCHCHLSVFAPDRAGIAVSGPAMDPLPRVRLELTDGEVLATGVERAA